MARVALAASSTIEREELVRLLFAELSSVLPCDSLGFFWQDPGGDFLLTAVFSSDGGPKVDQVCISPGPDDQEDGSKPLCSPDNATSAHPVLRWLAGREFASSLCVPVVVAHQWLGGLVASRTRAHSFSPWELHPLAHVGYAAGPALNSIRLYERLEAAHRDLIAAKEELARSERLMVQGELATGVAHDINNILGLIAARADLLMLQGLSGQAHGSVEAIRRAVDDGITVVRRMTQFARKQRSRQLVALEVNRVVEDAMEMTRPRWQARQSSTLPPIRVRFGPGQVSTVMGVATELREVMVNLIMNAVDAMPAGGEIQIETCQEGSSVVICVSDTGCGMTEAVHRRIFEPFFTTKGEAGSGLGLWVSKGIVARHGGEIQVRSEQGRGSSFRVRLPSTEPAPLEPPGEVDRRRAILLVDDEIGLAEAMKLSLEMAGYRVVASADSRRALELFKEGSFDLVITDLRMPGVTGWELAAEIKRQSSRTPVMAITGWPVDLIRDGETASALDVILQKPLRVNDLRAKVAKLLADGGGDLP